MFPRHASGKSRTFHILADEVQVDVPVSVQINEIVVAWFGSAFILSQVQKASEVMYKCGGL